MEKLKLTEVEALGQVLTARKWLSWDVNPYLSACGVCRLRSIRLKGI